MQINYVKDDEWSKKYKNFRKAEFECPCCHSIGKGIYSSLVENMQKLRDKYGEITITSGYRCEKYNKEVGGTTNSQHKNGGACDFYIKSGITQNQDKRIEITKELQKMPNYYYSYCNVNGNYPNMGPAIHFGCNATEEKSMEDVVKELESHITKLEEQLNKIREILK